MASLRLRRLSLPFCTFLLLLGELLFNAIAWVITAVLFGRRKDTEVVLGLGLLAWVRTSCTYHAVLIDIIDTRLETWSVRIQRSTFQISLTSFAALDADHIR